ncbi:hypothetical protein AYO20_09792 [Fonsecaea nubica]|uniref:Uncharacterized protein n=1 Tax=Fonsecaea nubica TaxID=856822 RepID=A0A178CFE5_9EURO|nr:hypothetical protein AYO20_09792 [Fonsecaea nubica]OAL27441.1 hypothetical protein AYO20_09792 [Fonsecaea nubica]
MAEPGGSNQDKAQRPQIPVGEPLDQTPRVERLRRGLALHEAVMGVEPPRRRRTWLTPVARDKFGVPLVMSNLPQKKAGPRKRRVQQQQQQQQQQQTRNQQQEQQEQHQSTASIAPSRPSPFSSVSAPAFVAGPAAPAMSMSLPATARAPAHMSAAPKPTRTPAPLFARTQTQKTRHDTHVPSDFVGNHGNKKVKTTTMTTSDDAGNVVGMQNPVRGARSDDADGRETKGNSGNVTKGPRQQRQQRQQGGAEQQPGKLTVISAEQLHDLRADLVQSARENSDLRHEVEVLEQRLAQTEEERQTYWACGMEWARRERALVLEMEFWREQARSTATTMTTTTTEHYPDDMGDVDDMGAIGGPVQYGFIGGGYFGDHGHGHGHGPAQQTGLGTEYAFDADFAAGFGAGPGADPWTGFDDAGFGAATGPDHLADAAACDADELDKERDVMLRMD